MEIKIIFDKDTLDKSLHTGWGVSFLVNETVLFDTGENGEWLVYNMKKLNVDFNKLSAVVISHQHWDHTGGLKHILCSKKGLKVYGCSDFSEDLKRLVFDSAGNFIACKRVFEVLPGIFTTGEISGLYNGSEISEQALVLKTEKGISLLTGCSHPGIDRILELVRKDFPPGKPGNNFYAVLGGFHMPDKPREEVLAELKKFKKMDVKKVGPTHCSGERAEDIFRESYRENFISVKAGQTLQF